MTMVVMVHIPQVSKEWMNIDSTYLALVSSYRRDFRLYFY